MKTLFLKIGMPVAAAVLAIAGAFATTSMQNSSSAFAKKIGYTLNAQGQCDIAVICNDVPTNEICRSWYPWGSQAFGKHPTAGNCVYILWRNRGQ